MDKKELSIYMGRKIREYRKKRGLTQKELGEKIGVKHNTISSYESGVISPEQDALFALSRALDCRVDDFFPSGDESLHRAVEISDEKLDIEDLHFLNNLIRKAKSLDLENRKKFISSIKIAVQIFDDSQK